MKLNNLTIATMVWARSSPEEELFWASLTTLAEVGPRLMVADGGSRDVFLAQLETLPNVTLLRGARGVVPQTRASLRAALAAEAPFILYTEPDKLEFFRTSLRAFIADAPSNPRLGVSIAARTPASFQTFPATQRRTEGTTNALFARETGVEGDFCDGPLIINRALIPLLDEIPDDLGWGWRFYLMGRAQRASYELRLFATEVPCPADQQDDTREERMHRMSQLRQNLDGMIRVLGAQAGGG
jgi:hypothetical protein